MEAIKTTGLTKSYGKSRGIIDVNLSVKAGEFFGFIGPNGAGKSTTIRTLLGLIKADSGMAQIFEKKVGEEQVSVLQDIGYLPSETIFYHGMRVKDVLRLSADLHGIDCSAVAQELCERLSLDLNKKVEELSFGNRKKVGIVCAAQHKPKLFILDEPTSGLDPLMQKAFFEILEERNKEGATIFLSSHILSEIQHHCSRAAIIREGRIIACDKVEQLGKNNAKRITLHGVTKMESLEGIRDMQLTTDGISFLYSGDIKLLLRTLEEYPLNDLTIAEPDLEEIFMHYYTGEEQTK